MTTPDLPVESGLVAAAVALDRAAAAARHAILAAEVSAANRAYYLEDAPKLSDAEYDAKLRELVALEAAFPEDLPVRRIEPPPPVGAAPARPASAPRVRVPGERLFRDGDRVAHARFGDGVVVTSKLTRDDEEVTVAFRSGGVKTLLASMAHLEHAG